MAIVLFERNGQGYFNFDELLGLASVEFVERVRVCVELYEKCGIEFDVKVDLEGDLPSVYLYQKERVRVFKWYGTGSYGEVILSKRELLEMVGGFNG